MKKIKRLNRRVYMILKNGIRISFKSRNMPFVAQAFEHYKKENP